MNMLDRDNLNWIESNIERHTRPQINEQIAREEAAAAADHLVTGNLIHREGRPRAASILKSHIVTAIEKAHQSGWHEGRQYQVEYGTPAQPQRSEQATLASEAAEKAAKQLLNESEWHEDNVISVSGEIEPFIDEALRKQQLPLIEGYIRMFVEAILHGSDEHRIWLKEAGECFVNGRPMPERPCPCLVPPAAVATSEPQELKSAEALARFFHDTYEMLAPSFGYETRQDTREFDPESKNGRLMVTVCGGVLVRINVAIAAEREHYDLNLAVWEKDNQDLRQKLLAAQAAIARHIAEHDECEDFDFAKFDLSLLREHDDEVRKPLETANLRLVEALEPFAAAAKELNVMGGVITPEQQFVWKPSSNKRETAGITAQDLLNADAALAQVKEQP